MPAIGTFTGGPFHALAFDAAAFHIGIGTLAGIAIGGVDVRDRVRMDGLTIRDVLNDAPNTCNLTMEGDGPAVGQSIRVTLNEGTRVLFAGTIQTIDQSYESLPEQIAWHVTAIDDTGKANARRPFGTFDQVSATTIAQSITADYAPTFSNAGIQLGLPDVSIVFDGSETLIACLARLAMAIGGYTKIEDGTIYLFLEDTDEPPEPIDADHPFLNSPPIQINTDSSQLRTRVYGKGYGETIPADIDAGESLIPIEDGVNFPPLGGDAIVGLSAEGAQSERIQFSGVELSGGGTLVGPGAAPTFAPTAVPAAGAGVDSGTHTVSVVFTTATGKTLASPPASVDAGTHAPPGTAPTAGTATNGTGPDQGSHDYAVAFVLPYGETVAGPIGNAIVTSAASGQIAAPTSGPYGSAQSGAGLPDGWHEYVATFINATGETPAGPAGGSVNVAPVLTGQLTAPFSTPTLAATVGAGVGAGNHDYGITFGDTHGDTTIGPLVSITAGLGGQLPDPGTFYGYISAALQAGGGGLAVGENYWWYYSFGNAAGDTLLNTTASNNGSGLFVTAGNTSANLTNIPIGPAGTTNRKVWRRRNSGGFTYYLVATINDNTTTAINDAVADASVGPAHGGSNTTAVPYHVINLTNIPIGPAGTTNRKIWRQAGGFGPRYVGTVSDNLTTVFTDTTPTASLGAAVGTSNTTGSMVPNNQVDVYSIPTGPAGTTGRGLYRRWNFSGSYLLVTTIGNNTATGYLDTKSQAALGAAAPVSNTTGTAVQRIPITNIPIGPAGVTSRKLYRRFNGAGTFKLVTTIGNNTGTTFTDAVANSALGAAALTTATAIGNQILVTVPIGGAAAVTGREVYMSPVANTIRKRVAVIADNTTTTLTITTSDAGLTGPVEPAADTSGLSQPQGQVNPGAAILPVASAATFRAGGGWVRLGGGQTVRYTAVSGQTLTGIPATGAGAITTTVLYGQQAIPAPMLIGVVGLTRPVLKGSSVHIFIQRDDLLAQTEHAARTGGDGVVEYLITDDRRGVESLTALCDADLKLFSRPIVTVAYATRDIKTKSGKTVPVDLPSPSVHETLIIHEVTITEIDLVHGLPPRFMVKASTVRFSLEDTLRRLITGTL